MVARGGVEPPRLLGAIALQAIPEPYGSIVPKRLVPPPGLEPGRPRGHSALDATRLPIPPRRRLVGLLGFEPRP